MFYVENILFAEIETFFYNENKQIITKKWIDYGKIAYFLIS